MDWLSVAKLIAPLAPALGGILGGFIPIPGGGLIGQQLGNVIAKHLGVPGTPDDVARSLQQMEHELAIEKLKAAADEARARWPAYAEAEKAYYEAVVRTAEAVNMTMRAEIQPENRHWFYTGWRPMAGWIFDVQAVVFGAILAWATIRAMVVDPGQLRVLTDAWPIFAAYFGILAAMVGVYVFGRSQEKTKATEVAQAPPPKPGTTRR